FSISSRRLPLMSTLFPYTPLFRSDPAHGRRRSDPSSRERRRPFPAARGLARRRGRGGGMEAAGRRDSPGQASSPEPVEPRDPLLDRKSTRLNSSHVKISYAVFFLK